MTQFYFLNKIQLWGDKMRIIPKDVGKFAVGKGLREKKKQVKWGTLFVIYVEPESKDTGMIPCSFTERVNVFHLHGIPISSLNHFKPYTF